MKKASKSVKRLLIAAMLPVLALTSCVSDNEAPPRIEEGDTDVTFSVMLPGNTIATYGMTDEGEYHIQDMDILAFEPTTGEYVYTARCSGSAKFTDGTGTEGFKTKTFTVKLRQGEFDHVLLANARGTLSGLSFDGKTKAEALALIKVVMPNGGFWLTNGTCPIPMWGEVKETISSTTSLTGNKAVRMSRMLAKVDVKIAASNFKLKSVRVYNYNTQGSIAPDPDKWDTSNPDKPKATAPNIPTGSATTKGPLLYTGSGVVKDKECLSEIYLFEYNNHNIDGTPKALNNRACLVIGGLYGTDTEETFYRVDFSGDGGETYLDLLRNHSYTFTITDVAGPGCDGPATAFESESTIMDVNIVPWNDGEYNIKFNGNYYLSVSKGKWEFNGDAHGEESEDNILYVDTDYKDGWNYTVTYKSEDPTGWLSLLGWASGAKKSTAQLKLLTNDSENDRTGYILITAGNLSFQVEVVQEGTVTTTGIEISETSLYLLLGDEPKALTASLVPSNATDQALNWSQDNPLVAVYENGFVRPVGEGATTIRVSTTGGAFEKTCKVTVEIDKSGTVEGADGKVYKTWDYDGVIWMVQNSEEGTYSATNYLDQAAGANGYYYTWDQAKNACPSGWSLPTIEQWNALEAAVNNDRGQHKAKWWTKEAYGAFAGYYSGSSWISWGGAGLWWTSNSSDKFFNANIYGLGGPYTNDVTYWFSVRCVKD